MFKTASKKLEVAVGQMAGRSMRDGCGVDINMSISH
jgi:hypothetical protein